MVALWLVPSPQDAEILKKIMPTRDNSVGQLSKSSYPTFEPHVTLASISPRNLAEIHTALAPLPRSMRIHFAALDTGDHYFRSVYISIKPSQELLALHGAFHENIRVEPRTPSFPHCSVCYIADEDAGERSKFEKGLREGAMVQEGEDGVRLRCGDVWMSGWEAREIWVVQCEGPVEGWKVLDKIPLSFAA